MSDTEFPGPAWTGAEANVAAQEPTDDLGRRVIAECPALGLHVNIVRLPGMDGVFRMASPPAVPGAGIHRGPEILDTALATAAG